MRVSLGLLFTSCLLLCPNVAANDRRTTFPPSLSNLPSPLRVRGGGWAPPPIYEVNPNYVGPYNGKHISGGEQLGPDDSDPNRRFYIESHTTTFSLPTSRPPTLWQRTHEYLTHLHRTAPELSITLWACVGLFIAWQIPAWHSVLRQHALCARSNLARGQLHSLLLSAVSHTNLWHLLANLAALVTLGPRVRQGLAHKLATTKSRNNNTTPARPPTLTPLLLGAALSSSLAFVLRHPHGRGLGLSGVTFGLLAVDARWQPNRTIRFLLAGVIPVALPASHLLQLAVAVSALGTVWPNVLPNIAHAAHLGGLLFGMAYAEWRTMAMMMMRMTQKAATTTPRSQYDRLLPYSNKNGMSSKSPRPWFP